MATGYGGTYKAIVIDNVDPMGENRLMVRVPDAGIESEWARPLAGSSVTLPSVADEILVQFEGGDTDHPVWHTDGVAAPAAAHYPGVYRAVVVNNQDPMQSNRLQVQVPEVLGSDPVWATPPTDLIPAVGGSIWVQFDGGDPDHPQWAGHE